MDATKLKHLVEQLSAQPAPQLIPIATFFDGNDNLGSIGCNLMEHPGMFVVGTTHADELAEELSALEPDEVGSAEDFGIPDALARKYTAPIHVAWWD